MLLGVLINLLEELKKVRQRNSDKMLTLKQPFKYLVSYGC